MHPEGILSTKYSAVVPCGGHWTVLNGKIQFNSDMVLKLLVGTIMKVAAEDAPGVAVRFRFYLSVC